MGLGGSRPHDCLGQHLSSMIWPDEEADDETARDSESHPDRSRDPANRFVVRVWQLTDPPHVAAEGR